MPEPKTPRRQQILEALASELESNPGDRITTARLARVVGVSEAALYRHFRSKASMFESLIEFAEETVFGLVGRILGEEPGALRRCERIVTTVLTFSDRNPGITRVLLGDALVGESQRLRDRVGQFFARLETQLKQVLREGEMAASVEDAAARGDDRAGAVAAYASLLMAVIEGRMTRFVRSGLTRSPLEEWERQWDLLHRAGPRWLARP